MFTLRFFFEDFQYDLKVSCERKTILANCYFVFLFPSKKDDFQVVKYKINMTKGHGGTKGSSGRKVPIRRFSVISSLYAQMHTVSMSSETTFDVIGKTLSVILEKSHRWNSAGKLEIVC